MLASIRSLTASLAPNPANDITVLSLTLPVNARITVEVINNLQQTVLTQMPADFTAGAQTITIPTATLANGMYTVYVSAVASDGTVYRAVLPFMVMR